MTTAAEETDAKEQPLVSHLIELRNRILYSFAAVVLVFICLFPWANEIYMFVSEPLTRLLSEEESMISTKPTGTFFAPFKLAIMVAVFITVPFLLHQAWAFISPGLYRHEIKVTFPILLSSVVLFYVGLLFCYFVVLDFMFPFFYQTAPDNVLVMVDVNDFLDFTLSLFLVFGVVFEIPVATVLLVMSGVTTPNDLLKKRGYIVIGCFAIAIPLTPADPISQSMLAIPMWLLFELGVFASRLLYRPDEEEEAPESASTEK